MIHGIDVSVAQGNLSLGDWRAVAQSGVRFVYAKCGNGNDGVDSRFAANVTGARAVGLVVGAYHVGFPIPLDALGTFDASRGPIEQARAHAKAAGDVGMRDGDLPPCFDAEWPMPIDWARWGCTAPQIQVWCLAYRAELERLCGRPPAIYTYPDWWGHVTANGAAVAQEFSQSPLFLARYGTKAPGTLAPWPAPALWQRSDGGGRLPNGSPVDEDEFLGDEVAWEAFRRVTVDVTAGGDAPLYTAPEPPARDPQEPT